MKNYYDILGVLPDADIQTVKFTYKALAKIYHPDTYQGDKKYAEKKMKDINEVYKCLSNQKLRSKYDNAFFSNKAKSSKFRDFNENQETSQHEEPINDEWHYAIKYHPELIQHYNVLKKLNQKLAFQFQINIVEKKAYWNAQKITENYIIQYLQRYFGTNSNIHNIVFNALMKDRKDIANKINNSINKLGESSHKAIIEKLKLEYPNYFNFFIDKKFSYGSYATLNSVGELLGGALDVSNKLLNQSVNLVSKVIKIILVLSLFGIICSIIVFIFLATAKAL